MRIVHLSDLHITKERLSSLKQFYTPALIADLKKWNKKKKIDLIFITGDLVDKGGKSFEKNEDYYKIIEDQFIKELETELGLTKSNIIFIPGNHDIEEYKIEDISEDGLLKFSTIERINKFVLDHKLTFHTGTERSRQFKEFEKRYYGTEPNCYLTNFETCFVKAIDGIKIGIAAFNSSWRCSSKLPKENLLFGTQQILDASDFFKEQGTSFNVALIHHPIEFISDIERRELTSFLHTRNFEILFGGHTHSSDTVHSRGTRNKLFTLIAKTAFSDPREKIDTYKPGYTIVDFDIKLDEEIAILCNYRKYVHDRISFDKDVDAAENGEYRDKIILNSSDDEFRKYLVLTDKTCKAKQEVINSSLVIHGTDSIAPRSLSEIFVLPKLTDTPVPMTDLDENVKLFKIEEILDYDRNVLIIGDKETGKSTLLNKLFIEASNSYSKYQVIPVEIDFSELKKRDIKTLVRSFLNEPSHLEIEACLDQGTILVLIDNYIENDDHIHAVNRLKKFIDEYPENKLIVTTSTDINTLLTSENTIFAKKSEEDSQKEFKPIFIGSVGVKEFKELAIKWFKRKDSEWIQNNLEKLIKVFEILRIPRTFFSVSLFLWIIEKQENFKPINKANLVQQFLTFILEGLRADNAKAGSYNFDKKVELLTELALFMYNNGDKSVSYSISETKAITCIQENFDLNQLKKLSASEKLNEFIEKGILKHEVNNNCIRFRYDAFFQFFLSLNIEKNPEFKKEVFSDEKFLSFVDELDYHTGRKRDDFETLDFVRKKLQEAYSEIDAFIDNNVDKYFPNESFLLKHINPTNFVSETRANKLSDEEIEEALGTQLEMLPVNDSIKAKNKIDLKKKFYHALELTARILKNSENIKNPNYVNESLDLIINKSAKYGVYLQSIIAHNLANNKDDELPLPPEFFITIAPLLNELMLLSWLGTEFLETPLESKLKRYLRMDKKDLSEYELFLTGFIYSDMKLNNYVEYIDKVIDKVENKFILELCFIKVLLYYMFRPMNSSLLPSFEKQMAVLLVKSRGINKKKAKKYVEEVLRKKKEEAMYQLKLDI